MSGLYVASVVPYDEEEEWHRRQKEAMKQHQKKSGGYFGLY
jgi:hypothetical protein